MDHQWGEVASEGVGWDWASVQFDDGADLMVAVVWHPQGRRRMAAHGTYLHPDGTVSYLEDGDLTFTAQGAWTSPRTGVEYPVDWRVQSEALGLDLELSPFLEQAESDSAILNVAYWEGAVSVSGQREGQPVTGWGFVELAGYDPRRIQVTPATQTPQP